MRTHMTLKNAGSADPVAMVFGQANPCPAPVKARRTWTLASLKSLAVKPLKSVFDRIAPMGYEDETGFHYGAPDRRA